jgi:hypothetical protein
VWRVGELGTAYTIVEPPQIEDAFMKIVVFWKQIRVPAQPRIQRQVIVYLEVVLYVQRRNIDPLVKDSSGALAEAGEISQCEIRQRGSSKLAIERKVSVALESAASVEVNMDPITTEQDSVPASDERDVVSHLIDSGSEIRWAAIRAGTSESSANRKVGITIDQLRRGGTQ